ncbi:hypothetical protein CGRA01v4_03034 [Colletotrichum graminicola]|nr:hypothetical protein CGRA01v4_03034 [Colletotrichum graminicola]
MKTTHFGRSASPALFVVLPNITNTATKKFS